MARRGLFLAAAVAVAVLSVAAAGGEEPLPLAESGEGWGWKTVFVAHGPLAAISVLLGLAMAVSFIVGLVRRRHDWMPLVLGLFALGFGALNMALRLMDALEKELIERTSHGESAGDPLIATYVALCSLALGLGLVLAGGLFTVILRWRNERFRKREAAEAESEEGKQA